jgi:hypothetical protein
VIGLTSLASITVVTVPLEAMGHCTSNLSMPGVSFFVLAVHHGLRRHHRDAAIGPRTRASAPHMGRLHQGSISQHVMCLGMTCRHTVSRKALN